MSAPTMPSRTLHSLPPQWTSFIGRRSALEEIAGLLHKSALVTLVGPGGSGKTRLAIETARAAADRFPGATCLVDLTSVIDPALVPVACTTAFAIDDGGDEEPVRALALRLPDQPVLIILDNCEHLASATAEFASDLLTAAPQVRILATSREPLRIPGEQIWQVPPLALPSSERTRVEALLKNEAVQLFADRAAAQRPGFTVSAGNAAIVARICRELDGMPLAIELAAACMRFMAPEAIAERLQDRFRLLTRGPRSAQDRQTTLLGAIEWSCNLLSDAERLLWGRLSIFAGSFSLQAAEEVCGDAPLSRAQILPLLSSLADKSVVTADQSGAEPRYRLLESIRLFGQEMNARTGEGEPLERRLLTWAVARAEAAFAASRGPQQAEWFRDLDLDRDNLRQALGLARERGDRECGLRLITSLATYWIRRGLLREGRSWVMAFVHPDGNVDPSLWARAANSAGSIFRASGMYAEARRYYLESRSMAHEMGDYLAEAKAHLNVGLTYKESGALTEAITHYRSSLELFRRLGDEHGVALTLNNLAAALMDAGATPAEIEPALRESLSIFRRRGDKWGAAMAMGNLGQVFEEHGEVERAIPLLTESLTLRREIGDRDGMAIGLTSLGVALHDRGELRESLHCQQEGLRLRFEGDQLGAAAESLAETAVLLIDLGDAVRGVKLLAASATFRAERGNRAVGREIVRFERHADYARRLLGAARFVEAWSRGESLDAEAAMRLGLEPLPDDPTHAALAQCPAQPEPPSAFGLTAREQEIVLLIGQGLTVKQIAERLNVSPRTVEKHEESLRQKLNMPNRAALAAFAATELRGSR